MDKKQINEVIDNVMKKKEFSQLPRKDVEMALSRFEKREVSKDEKIRLTRELLHKIFGAFGSRKLLTVKDKEPEWILRKHLSTRERLAFYTEIYQRVLKGFEEREKISIIDLGAGVNGFSYKYFKEAGFNVDYFGIEAIGQFVEQMNNYFKREKISSKAVHLSLFELGKIKGLIQKMKKPRVVFLFKTIDSLEMMKRDYSKKLISEISEIVERIVVSFATESMVKRKRFKAKRTWIISFIEENFSIFEDFELKGERYIVFGKNQSFS